MATFKNYAEVSETDKRFTEIINSIQEAISDYFYTWEEFPGIQSSELTEYLGQFGDLYEDDKEELYIVYPANLRMVKSFIRWLANYDLVVVRNDLCLVEQSNHPEAAEMLNQLVAIAS